MVGWGPTNTGELALNTACQLELQGFEKTLQCNCKETPHILKKQRQSGPDQVHLLVAVRSSTGQPQKPVTGQTLSIVRSYKKIFRVCSVNMLFAENLN